MSSTATLHVRSSPNYISLFASHYKTIRYTFPGGGEYHIKLTRVLVVPFTS